jgi:hypothetical protein
MPHIRGLAESGDGRLLVLLANKEVRVMELREDELNAESILWDRLSSGTQDSADGALPSFF